MPPLSWPLVLAMLGDAVIIGALFIVIAREENRRERALAALPDLDALNERAFRSK